MVKYGILSNKRRIKLHAVIECLFFIHQNNTPRKKVVSMSPHVTYSIMPNSKFPSSRVSSESLLASILPAPSLSPKSEASRSTVTLLLDCLAVTTIFYFNKFIILFGYVSMTLSYQTGYDKKNASEIVKNYIETLQ